MSMKINLRTAIATPLANWIAPLLVGLSLLVTASISGAEPEPTAVGFEKKLDSQLTLALKQTRGQPPFDRPTSLEPNIPIKDGDRVLVDIEGSVSKQLLDQVRVVGGQLVSSSTTVTTVRAMIPLQQLESLARRPDVKSIAPAQLAVTSKVIAPPAK